jgi:20S proteasome alpha/beta subunit
VYESEFNSVGSESSLKKSTLSEYHDGMRPLFNGPMHHSYLSSMNSNVQILHAPTGLILAATGFKPDMSHLMNIATGRVLSRTSIYDPSTKSLDPHRLVRDDLSEIFIDAASSEGARPIGVQCLVIGQSCITRDLELYTIDPSGGWRSHVGWGAAVGRGAERVRSSLFKLSKSDVGHDKQQGWKLALDRAMLAAVDAFEVGEDSLSREQRSKHQLYGAVVVFGTGKKLAFADTNSRCAAIHPQHVKDSYQRCFERLLDDKRDASVSKSIIK